MTSSPSLFFDLDGTLTDPKPGITGCIQYALERMGEPVPTQDELEWCIGPALRDNFTRLISAEAAPRAVELYRERFGTIGLFENEVYAGIPEVLAHAKDRGARLYVASSKAFVYVERILEHFELAQFFDGVYGSELDGRLTDKAELLAHALERERIDPVTTTMIGDRENDVAGALANRMDFLGALYGYGSIQEFQAAGANAWVDAPHELPAALFPRHP